MGCLERRGHRRSGGLRDASWCFLDQARRQALRNAAGPRPERCYWGVCERLSYSALIRTKETLSTPLLLMSTRPVELVGLKAHGRWAA